MLRSKTVNIFISSPVEKVYRYVSDIAHLPEWGKTFCRSARKMGTGWVIETPQGPVKIRMAEKNNLGVLDHTITTASGRDVLVPVRVVPNGTGCEVIFTVFQQTDILDKNYAKDINLVKKDLRALKKVMEENSCVHSH
jgi:hypothetical protein